MLTRDHRTDATTQLNLSMLHAIISQLSFLSPLHPSHSLLPQPLDLQTWSEIKGQGQKSTKIRLFGPIMVIGLKSGYIEGHGGQVGYYWQRANCFWQLAKCCRRAGEFLQEAGKVPNVKKNLGRSISRQHDARCTSPYTADQLNFAAVKFSGLPIFLYFNLRWYELNGSVLFWH